MPNLAVGPELDAAVHFKVKGVVWDDTKCQVCGWYIDRLILEAGITSCTIDSCSMRPAPKVRADAVPPYSTSLSLAWGLLQWVQQAWVFSRRNKFYGRLKTLCHVQSLQGRVSGPPLEVAWPEAMGVFAAQMPALICQAAVDVVEFWPEEPGEND